MDNFLQDLRYGLRTLVKERSFTVIAVLTLAVGIGANATVFSVVSALVLRPYPFANLDQLALVRASGPHVVHQAKIAPADFLDLQRDKGPFQDVAAFRGKEATLTGLGDAEPVVVYAVTPNFFNVLATRATLGRTFAMDEGEPGRDFVVILNHKFWKRRFASDAGLVGNAIEIDGRKMIVAGVMPENFDYPVAADLWMPLALSPQEKAQRDSQIGSTLQVVGRLRYGVDLRQGEAELHGFAMRLQNQFPDTHRGSDLRLLRLREEQLAFSGPPFLVLQAAAIFVFLLAAANLLNLLFVRVLQRKKELAVRVALGASSRRLAQLFVTEILPILFIATVLAMACAYAGVSAIRDGIPVDYTKWIAGWSTIRVDRRVIAFSLALTAATAICFVLAAAWKGGKGNLVETLKEGDRSGQGGPRSNQALGASVIVQLTLATVLLATAGLMVRGFLQLARVYNTLDPTNVAVMRISLPSQRYATDGSVRSFFEQVLQGIQAVPGVVSAGIITNPPASNVDSPRTLLVVEGRPVLQQTEAPSADLQSVSPDYLRCLRISLLRGRWLTGADGVESPRVALVSRTMAKQLWSDDSPVGRRIKIGSLDSVAPWTTIVGVVEDVKQNWWDPEPRPVIYLTHAQAPKRTMEFAVRTAGDSTQVVSAIRGVARKLDPNVALINLQSMEGSISDSLAPLRILGILMVLFGGMAAAVAGLGIYGILSYSVTRRMHEFAIRMALGAQRDDLRRLVLGHAWKLAGIGLAIGLPLAFALSRVMRSVLFGIIGFNTAVFFGFALLLLMVAFVAAYVPARRATRADPISSLRSE